MKEILALFGLIVVLNWLGVLPAVWSAIGSLEGGAGFQAGVKGALEFGTQPESQYPKTPHNRVLQKPSLGARSLGEFDSPGSHRSGLPSEEKKPEETEETCVRGASPKEIRLADHINKLLGGKGCK